MDIVVKNVTKRIRKSEVLRDVSLELHSGRITGFSGINGSGKTMLMRIICGLVYPTEGEVLIGNKILGKEISFPDSIGILIENPAFLDFSSGFQNLKIIASIKKRISDEQIKRTIEEVGLNPSDKKKYRKYSLGMKQRLGIAAALMERPDIIILDEPTNALDADGIDAVKELIIQERDRGATVIISCHDRDILRELSDEIYTLSDGSVQDHENLGGSSR